MGGTLLAGGTVVTAADAFDADVLIEGQRIVAVGRGAGEDPETVVDARGKLVLPGCIDVHTHLDMPFGGQTTCDDFRSGSDAALAGGTTTIVDFCFQYEGQSLDEALDVWEAKRTRGCAAIDVGFHMAITDLAACGDLDKAIGGIVRRGVTSVKAFMAYKGESMLADDELFALMQASARHGVVVMVHAENGDVIAALVEQALAAGRTEPRWHATTRPREIEAEATNRAIQLARVAGCRLYVVHVSCSDVVQVIELAQHDGADVLGETCTHYLFIDEAALAEPEFESAKYVFSPPPRSPEDHRRLWDAVRRGSLSVVSSDHAPFLWAGQKTAGRDDFSKIPNGAPGIEERLHMLYTFGVKESRLSLTQLVDRLATTPARHFGLYPRKGTLAPGSDADIVVFDPTARHTISRATHHSAVDYSLYEGTEVVGRVETVLRRGSVVVEDGELTPASEGGGEYVPRAVVA